jgi:hypothetical protein
MDHNKPGNSTRASKVISTWPTPAAAERLLHPALSQRGKDKRDYLRGFGYQGRARARDYGRFNDSALIGDGLKKAFAGAGPWNLGMTAFGEILPYHDNHMRLDRDKKDKHGCRCSSSTPSCARTSARWNRTCATTRPRCSRPRATRTSR